MLIIKKKEQLLKLIVPFIPKWIHPNHLSLFRLILTIPVIYLIYQEYYITGVIIFVLGFFLDALDGTLARTRNQITKLGKVLDPAADKIFFLAIFIILGIRFLDFNVYIFLLVVELFTLLQGLIALFFLPIIKKWGFTKSLGSNVYGKLKMTFQVLGIVTLIIGIYYSPFITVAEVSLIIAAALAIMSMLKHQIFENKTS